MSKNFDHAQTTAVFTLSRLLTSRILSRNQYVQLPIRNMVMGRGNGVSAVILPGFFTLPGSIGATRAPIASVKIVLSTLILSPPSSVPAAFSACATGRNNRQALNNVMLKDHRSVADAILQAGHSGVKNEGSCSAGSHDANPRSIMHDRYSISSGALRLPAGSG